MAATTRTAANDRAANAAFKKAQKESKAIANSWVHAMHIATSTLMGTPEAERKQYLERAAKLAAQEKIQQDIIEAARAYARLPKE